MREGERRIRFGRGFGRLPLVLVACLTSLGCAGTLADLLEPLRPPPSPPQATPEPAPPRSTATPDPSAVDPEAVVPPRSKPNGRSSADSRTASEAAAVASESAQTRRVVLRGASVMTAAGPTLPRADVLIQGDRIAEVGPDLEVSAPVAEIDARGRWITPGLIDPHSHIGVAASPAVRAHEDANELSGPLQPAVRAEDAFWPQDPGLRAAASGGVTLIHVLPGSGNVIGGQGISLHVRPSPDGSVAALAVEGAPRSMKMACGENPKRVYGARNSAPATRMGTEALLRQALVDARAYEPPRDEAPQLGKAALAEVLAGETLIQNHCYRADEIHRRLALFAEFGVRPRAFHHAVEAYKLRDTLATQGVGAVVWADWWGRKLEMLDAVPANAALLDRAGVRVALHSDSPYDVQRLNQQAAKALAAGQRAGIEVDRDRAIRWITLNAAWILGLDDRYGSIESGKRADLVVWSGDPFSVYSRADLVFSGGRLTFDRNDPEVFPPSDFVLGSSASGALSGPDEGSPR